MKYVNDKYEHHYKNIDMKNQYNKDKKDYSCVLIGGFFIIPLCFLILISVAFSIADNSNRESKKNKFIEIKRNSLGCVQYRYNQDKVWKCPKDLSISQIEKRVCSGGKVNTCRTEYEPVIN